MLSGMAEKFKMGLHYHIYIYVYIYFIYIDITFHGDARQATTTSV